MNNCAFKNMRSAITGQYKHHIWHNKMAKPNIFKRANAVSAQFLFFNDLDLLLC